MPSPPTITSTPACGHATAGDPPDGSFNANGANYLAYVWDVDIESADYGSLSASHPILMRLVEITNEGGVLTPGLFIYGSTYTFAGQWIEVDLYGQSSFVAHAGDRIYIPNLADKTWSLQARQRDDAGGLSTIASCTYTVGPQDRSLMAVSLEPVKFRPYEAA